MYKFLVVIIFFFCRWALTLPPRVCEEATSALWLTSLGAPLVAEVYRKLGWDRDSLSRHEPNGHNIAVMTRWNGDTPKSICHVFRHRGTFWVHRKSTVETASRKVGFDNARNYHFHCYLANSSARCFSIFIVHEVCCWSCAHQYSETFWLSLQLMYLSARSVLFSVDPFRRSHCLCDELLYCFGILFSFSYHLSMAGSFWYSTVRSGKELAGLHGWVVLIFYCP